jgi:hypothetical protein
MCNCEQINGALYVCDACRAASQQLFDEKLKAAFADMRECAVREYVYATFSVQNPAAQRAAYHVINEVMRDYNPRPRLSPEAYLALIYAEMD